MALIYSPTYRLLKYKYAASIRFLIMLVLILLEFLQSHITMIILVFHYLTPIPMHAPKGMLILMLCTYLIFYLLLAIYTIHVHDFVIK